MKICFLIPGNIIGGGVKTMVRLASHLSENHEVTLLYPVVKYFHLYHRLKKTTLLAKTKHIIRELYQYKSEFCFSADLSKRVKLSKYFLTLPESSLDYFDVIIYPSVWQYHELKKFTLHGIQKIHWTLADYLFCSSIEHPINNILEAYLSDDIIVAPSQITKNNLQTYGFKVGDVIHGGIDPIFNPSGRSWNAKKPTILGYFQPAWWVKGAATLVQCLKQLRMKYPEIRIELFGHQNSEIEKTGSMLCDRFYTGLSSVQVADLCRSHDIFVYPSYTDGFPSPPLEAMACGCAVVATEVGAVPEYIRHEQNALMCKPMDHEDMFRQVERLILDEKLRSTLIKKAVDDASQWTWEACADKFNSLIYKTHVKR